MSAKEILKMIEEVSPDDTAKLDEIDARFWCFKNGHSYIDGKGSRYKAEDKGKVELYEMRPQDTVTRSRDALKAIRPQQGCSVFRLFNADDWDGWKCQISWFPTSVAKYITSPTLKTEELAELHAIIQAIEYERG